MKVQTRIKRLKKYIYDPQACPVCLGTGIDQSKKNRKMNGCARCFVRTTLGVRLPTKEFKWILKKLETL